MSTSRREEIVDRVTNSSFVKNVVGPKVLEPVSSWYQDNLADDPAPSSTSTEASASDSLAAAQSAEAFLAGEAQDIPTPRPEPIAPTPKGAMLAAKGAAATVARPAVGGFKGFKDIAMRVKANVKEHNLNVVAAGVAFWGLLAIPAILTAIVSIYGLVASPEDVEDQINDALSGASEEARTLIGDQLSAVAGGSGGGLAIGAAVGILLALWTSSGAVAKVMNTLNTIWGVSEDRKFVKLRGTALIITLGAIVFVLGAGFLLAALPPVLDEAGLGDAARWAMNIGRFPAMLVFMAVGLSVLYWIGPNRKGKLRIITWGAVWATILWLLLSGLFTVYTSTFASYNETYGSLGAIVVLLLWLFITAFMVLVGAEIDAAREARAAELTSPTAADAA